MSGEGAVDRDGMDAGATAVSVGPSASNTTRPLAGSPLDGTSWRGAARVAGDVLDRYVRSPWAAMDLVFAVALFAFIFGHPFDATYFAASGFFPLALLSAVSGYALARGVASPASWEALARREGTGPCVAGMLLAAGIVRCAAVELVALLAAVLGRFTDASPLAVVVAMVGLALGSTLAAGVVVALSAPGAPRVTPLVALAALVVSLAAFGMDGTLGAAVWVCRLPLLPFAAAYMLGTGGQPWAWPAALALTVVALGGLGWLASRRLAAHIEAGAKG